MSEYNKAPKGKYRVVGGDACSMWIEKNFDDKDFDNFKDARDHADKKVATSEGRDSMSVFNEDGTPLYSTGLIASVERTRPIHPRIF